MQASSLVLVLLVVVLVLGSLRGDATAPSAYIRLNGLVASVLAGWPDYGIGDDVVMGPLVGLLLRLQGVSSH